MYKALTVGQASGDRHADTEPSPLERKEPDDCRPVGKHGDADIGAKTAYGDRELGAQKRIRQRSRLTLHRMPRDNFVWPKLTWTYHRDLHLTLLILPIVGVTIIHS